MEIAKGWFGFVELKLKMIYLLGTLLFLQSLFWWLFRYPVMSLDWIIELKFLNLFMVSFLIWIISGKSKKI